MLLLLRVLACFVVCVVCRVVLWFVLDCSVLCWFVLCCVVCCRVVLCCVGLLLLRLFVYCYVCGLLCFVVVCSVLF